MPASAKWIYRRGGGSDQLENFRGAKISRRGEAHSSGEPGRTGNEPSIHRDHGDRSVLVPESKIVFRWHFWDERAVDCQLLPVLRITDKGLRVIDRRPKLPREACHCRRQDEQLQSFRDGGVRFAVPALWWAWRDRLTEVSDHCGRIHSCVAKSGVQASKRHRLSLVRRRQWTRPLRGRAEGRTDAALFYAFGWHR
jgi:hypothetical protein